MSRRQTLSAIALYLFALLLFDAMGLVIKRLSPSYSAAELSAYRNVFGMIPAVIALWLVPAWHRAGRPLRIRQWRMALFRGGFVVFAQLTFYLSLALMDFATATTISYAMALFMVGLAVPILGERVGLARWGAVLIGFVGVVLVMGVGRETFTVTATLPLIAAALYALAGITARLFDEDVPSPVMNLYSSSSAAVGAVILALFLGGFSAIQSWGDFAWIVLMGGFGGAAVLTLVISFRMAEQSDLAPFSYFGIPMAFVLGWLFFDEAPWDDLCPGALLIVLGGLIIIWRERRQSVPREEVDKGDPRADQAALCVRSTR